MMVLFVTLERIWTSSSLSRGCVNPVMLDCWTTNIRWDQLPPDLAAQHRLYPFPKPYCQQHCQHGSGPSSPRCSSRRHPHRRACSGRLRCPRWPAAVRTSHPSIPLVCSSRFGFPCRAPSSARRRQAAPFGSFHQAVLIPTISPLHLPCEFRA